LRLDPLQSLGWTHPEHGTRRQGNNDFRDDLRQLQTISAQKPYLDSTAKQLLITGGLKRDFAEMKNPERIFLGPANRTQKAEFLIRGCVAQLMAYRKDEAKFGYRFPFRAKLAARRESPENFSTFYQSGIFAPLNIPRKP
jgi:hypothetical protein